MKMISFVITLCILSTLFVTAAPSQYVQNIEILSNCEILDDSYFESDQTVTRYECLNAIMKAIGATEEGASGALSLLGSSYGGLMNDNAYHDGDGGYLLDKNGEIVLQSEGYPLTVNNDGNGTIYNYMKYTERGESCIKLAFGYGIAKGEIYDGRRYFNFDRAVTLSETILFMIRCLENREINDSTQAFQKAIEYSLVKQEDLFYNNADANLSPNNFCTILVRFLNQKRYHYFTDGFDSIDIQTDSIGSMTYLEYLTTRASNKK